MTKSKRDPRQVAAQALVRVQEGAYSHIVWDSSLEQSELSVSDRRLATRIFYGTLSHQRLLDAIWEKVKPDFLLATDPPMRAILRSALYQLRYLDRIPAYSVLNESVELAKRMCKKNSAGFCNALLRKVLPLAKSELEESGLEVLDFAIKYSLSDDLAQILIEEYGKEEAAAIALSFNEIPRLSLRVNLSKISLESLQSRLSAEKSKLSPVGLLLESWTPELDEALAEGLCAIQDEASQLVALASGDLATLPRVTGQEAVIWDACAGQGGKALQMMDRIHLEDKTCKLVCTDLYLTKLKRLKDLQKKNFPEQRFYFYALDLAEGKSVPMAPFSSIILDAPCSGLGVLRRHPEAKLSKTKKDIEDLSQLQQQLLDSVSKHLRVGASLIYAVCTITKDETTKQIEKFLETHSNFSRAELPPHFSQLGKNLSAVQLLTHRNACDGFFIARLVRTS